MTAFSELTSLRMLALARAALHGTIPDENLFINIGEADWNGVFELSTVQGVMVLSLNGAMGLPKDLQPPMKLKLRWIASVEAAEKRYRHCLETAEKLSSRFKENNIQMLLFKGLALSRLYPVPFSREFGDIDIFLCGKAKEGDALLERIAVKHHGSSKKHTGFYYGGILIENHHTFLNHNYKSFHHSEALEKRLMMMLTEAGIFEEATSVASRSVNETLLFPPPDFDALFVTLHTIAHFPSGILLRQLCDLTVLFTAYKGKPDFSDYREALSEAGLLKVADAFISLSVRKLGLNPEYAPPYVSDLSLENRIWDNMLNPEGPLLPKEKRSSFNVFFYKIRLLRAYRWKYELVFSGKFREMIFRSIFFYLRHPKIIGKL